MSAVPEIAREWCDKMCSHSQHHSSMPRQPPSFCSLVYLHHHLSGTFTHHSHALSLIHTFMHSHIHGCTCMHICMHAHLRSTSPATWWSLSLTAEGSGYKGKVWGELWGREGPPPCSSCWQGCLAVCQPFQESPKGVQVWSPTSEAGCLEAECSLCPTEDSVPGCTAPCGVSPWPCILT